MDEDKDGHEDEEEVEEEEKQEDDLQSFDLQKDIPSTTKRYGAL